MDKATFFNNVRSAPFNGVLTERQVAGMDVILDEWGKRGLKDSRWLAYMLATAFHETGREMQPVREIGRGQGKKYGTTYYGRGFVQLTWDYNYRSMSTIVGADLVSNPDLALDMEIATKVMFEGMQRGTFTGKALQDYFHTDSDWYNARRIINGMDKATQIADYARAFWFALLSADCDATRQVPRSFQQPRDISSDDAGDEPVDFELREIFREFGKVDA
ncbi:MAG: hypothetical protein PHE17_13045 [Thiothrix sp.]|uniref:glycoside hydrolase family 19 protein n=1 Tax=Thiothrix sp. TaxID=1032 RepID=UPI00263857E6|nr:glycoside hydrolase family 19 protein [Thiothrix sp.]MDD5393939.1 hypothetical protein [Thiothrix sp.]